MELVAKEQQMKENMVSSSSLADATNRLRDAEERSAKRAEQVTSLQAEKKRCIHYKIECVVNSLQIFHIESA